MTSLLSTALIGSGFRTQLVNLGNVSGDVYINVNRGNEFLLTPVGTTTIYFNGLPPSGQVGYWSLEIRSPGVNVVSFGRQTNQSVSFDTGSGVIAGGTRSTVFAFRCRDGQTVCGATSFASIPG